MSSRAREKMRRSRPIHVERTPVRIGFKLGSGEAAEAQARVVLSAMSLDGVVLYCAEALAPNTEVKLTIENPEKFEIEAKIIWCQYQDSAARILTANPFPYRIGVAFAWKNEEDKERFNIFVQTARHHYDSVVVPAPKSNDVLVGAPKGDATVEGAISAESTTAADTAAATPESPKLEAIEGGATPATEAPKAETAPGETPSAVTETSKAA